MALVSTSSLEEGMVQHVTGHLGRVVRKAAVGVGVLALCVPLASASASAGESGNTDARRCVADHDFLPVPPESEWWPWIGIYGGSSDGRHLVGGDVLWVDGEPRVLTGLGPQTWAADANNSGMVVGTSGSGNGNRAWKYVDGTYTALPVPADAEEIVVRAINARGDIVGGYGHWTDEGYEPDHALFWPAPEGDRPLRYRVLRAPLPARAVDISNTGVIVGTVFPEGPWSGSGYLWRNWHSPGTAFVDADGDPTGARVNGISPNGRWVAGAYWLRSVAVRWDLETGAAAVGPRNKPNGYVAVNSRGDAATSENPDYYTSSVIVRANGTRVQLGSVGRFANVNVLPNRGSEITAAGEDEGLGAPDPIVWRGC